MKQITWLFWVSSILVCGCSVVDDNRCPDGFTYNPETRTCLNDEEVNAAENPTDVDTLDASPDGDDGGETDNDGDTRPSGLGKSCTDPADCKPYKEDFCTYSEMTKSGYCTIQNCAMGECPEGYICCDCTTSTLLPSEDIVCLTVEQGNMAASMAGCSCE